MKTILLWIFLALGLAGALLGALRVTGEETAAKQIDAVETFLDNYVSKSGRVVRTDQGGDTVSEGQAYGMLLAAAVGDEKRFASIWTWTRRNLQRKDHLLSWHWKDGKIVDKQPAADADLDAARALLLASKRFSDRGYRVAAAQIAGGILKHEVGTYGDRSVLVAGPWAKQKAIVNPSYFSPRTFSELKTATKDARWYDVTSGSMAVLRDLMGSGTLPPDWAKLDASGKPRPVANPDETGEGTPRYGLEAPRTLLRLAESCDNTSRNLAALAADDAMAEIAGSSHPVTLVGAAAAASAAGDEDGMNRALDQARSMAARHPTYYGWALVAYGEVALRAEALGRCEA